jgi:hypothetical protein
VFAGIDYKSVGHLRLHLILDEGAIREILDHVVRVHPATRRWLFDFFSSTGTTPSGVRMRQSGFPEMPQRDERNTFASKG